MFINNFSIRHWAKVTEMFCCRGGVSDVGLALSAPLCLCTPAPLLLLYQPHLLFVSCIYLFVSETVSLCSRGCFSLPGAGLQARPHAWLPGSAAAAVCLFVKDIIFCRSNATDFVCD